MHFHRCPLCSKPDTLVGQRACTETDCTMTLRLCEEHR
jgi:hypothetical protein